MTFPVTVNDKVLMWADVQDVEPQAMQQIYGVSALPWIHGLRVMADCHFGNGATVGSVIAMENAICPAAVGVDIGCGMGAIKTNLKASDLPDNLRSLRESIELAVPVGFNAHEDPVKLLKHGPVPGIVKRLWDGFGDLNADVGKIEGKARNQLGTLGGGNHFIEVCLDTDDGVWIMLHSGSRNIGKVIAEQHINKAKVMEHNVSLPVRDLAVFLKGSPELEAYRADVMWAQNFAFANRQVMIELVKGVVKSHFPQVSFGDPILCHHNYISEEIVDGVPMFITRKGAISAKEGEMGIIPGSMGTRSFIVRGLGNAASYQSASHGAGRVMSRSAAKRHFTVEDVAEQTAGVECRKDASIIDEIPGSYKDIELVIAAQADLVAVEARLKQILCVKG